MNNKMLNGIFKMRKVHFLNSFKNTLQICAQILIIICVRMPRSFLRQSLHEIYFVTRGLLLLGCILLDSFMWRGVYISQFHF